MGLQASFFTKVFVFNFDARTSRGRMRERKSWFVKIWDEANPQVFGIGECAPLPGLSIDDRPEYEQTLAKVVSEIPLLVPNPQKIYDQVAELVPKEFPSIRFGMETALLDYINGCQRLIFKNSFIQGTPIPINGLVWMGDLDLMLQQASDKIAEGFNCIKIKVGGLNFEKECDILHYIRRKYFREEIVLRLDANGAFKPEEAMYKLHDLSRFSIHSIEQPVKPGQRIMEELCRKTPIPIALDEEMIGVEDVQQKQDLLSGIRPQFIIIKPSLHGGIRGAREWISIAEQLGIGWWMTSALESNIGLNAICQFTAEYPITMPQGLGTGALYENNFESPLSVSKGKISYSPKLKWNLSESADSTEQDPA